MSVQINSKTQAMDFLRQVAAECYGSGKSEGEKGGYGRVGMIGGRPVKFNTHKSAFLFAKETQAMRNSCNELRLSLKSAVDSLCLDRITRTRLYRELGLTDDGRVSANAKLLSRRVLPKVLKDIANEARLESESVSSAEQVPRDYNPFSGLDVQSSAGRDTQFANLSPTDIKSTIDKVLTKSLGKNFTELQPDVKDTLLSCLDGMLSESRKALDNDPNKCRETLGEDRITKLANLTAAFAQLGSDGKLNGVGDETKKNLFQRLLDLYFVDGGNENDETVDDDMKTVLCGIAKVNPDALKSMDDFGQEIKARFGLFIRDGEAEKAVDASFAKTLVKRALSPSRTDFEENKEALLKKYGANLQQCINKTLSEDGLEELSLGKLSLNLSENKELRTAFEKGLQKYVKENQTTNIQAEPGLKALTIRRLHDFIVRKMADKDPDQRIVKGYEGDLLLEGKPDDAYADCDALGFVGLVKATLAKLPTEADAAPVRMEASNQVKGLYNGLMVEARDHGITIAIPEGDVAVNDSILKSINGWINEQPPKNLTRQAVTARFNKEYDVEARKGFIASLGKSDLGGELKVALFNDSLGVSFPAWATETVMAIKAKLEGLQFKGFERTDVGQVLENISNLIFQAMSNGKRHDNAGEDDAVFIYRAVARLMLAKIGVDDFKTFIKDNENAVEHVLISNPNIAKNSYFDIIFSSMREIIDGANGVAQGQLPH